DSGLDQSGDTLDTLDVGVGVCAVPVGAAPDVEQALVLVVPDQTRRHTGVFGDVSDLHAHHLRRHDTRSGLDIDISVKVYGRRMSSVRTVSSDANATAALPWPALLTIGAATLVMVTAEMLPTAVLTPMSVGLGVSEGRTGHLVSVWALTVVIVSLPL